MSSVDQPAREGDDDALTLIGNATELTKGEVHGFKPEGGVVPPYVRYPDP